MTRFIVDAQLPPALARWLVAEGYEAEHVVDFGGEGTTDMEIIHRASQIHATIISKDEDFAAYASSHAVSPQIVWLRIGNTRRAQLLALFSQLLPEILVALQRGDRLVEIT